MKLFGISSRAAEATAQARVDNIVASARRRSPPPFTRRAAAPAPLLTERSSATLDRRVEEELHFARRMVEQLGNTLCDDPILVHRHGTALQSVDVLMQTLSHLAAIVGAADRAAAVEHIGMHELRSRLTRPDDGIAAASPVLNRTLANPFHRA